MRLDSISPPKLGLLEAGLGPSAASWDITTGPELRACLSNQHRLCCARSVLNLLSRWSALEPPLIREGCAGARGEAALEARLGCFPNPSTAGYAALVGQSP